MEYESEGIEWRSVKFEDNSECIDLISSCSEREIWLFLKARKITKTEEAMPIKIGLHAFHINLYLHEIFSQFYFLTPMNYSSWSEKEI